MDPEHRRRKLIRHAFPGRQLRFSNDAGADVAKQSYGMTAKLLRIILPLNASYLEEPSARSSSPLMRTLTMYYRSSSRIANICDLGATYWRLV
jgi:hypothetical protein